MPLARRRGIARRPPPCDSSFGFTNVTDACVDPGTGFFCGFVANPNEYLFWDSAHPTTAAHAVLGSQFAAAAVPEPATLLLLGTGLVVAATARGRRRTRG